MELGRSLPHSQQSTTCPYPNQINPFLCPTHVWKAQLVSFLVGLRTYQHTGNIPDERRPRLFTTKMETVRNFYVITNQLNVVRISANTNDSQKWITRLYHWQSSLLASPFRSENIWGTEDTSPSYNLFYTSQWVHSVPIFTCCIQILNLLKCITKLCLWRMHNDSVIRRNTSRIWKGNTDKNLCIGLWEMNWDRD